MFSRTTLALCSLFIPLVSGWAQISGGTGSIVFSNENLGLPWPLPDVNNFGTLLIHGQHCVNVLLNFNTSDTSSMNLAHQAHCQQVAQLMLAYFQQTPSYTASSQICANVLSSLQQLDWEFDYHFKYSAAATCAIEFSYTFSYNSVCNTLYTDQNQGYVALEAQNLGGLIMQQYSGTLTQPQATYMQQFTSPNAVQIGALGVYCTYGQNTIPTLIALLDPPPQQ